MTGNIIRYYSLTRDPFLCTKEIRWTESTSDNGFWSSQCDFEGNNADRILGQLNTCLSECKTRTGTLINTAKNHCWVRGDGMSTTCRGLIAKY